MTRIDFYTNVQNPQLFACKLVNTVFRKGEKLLVLLDDESSLNAFSNRLWCTGDTSFIPHCPAGAAEAGVTPIWLGTTTQGAFLPPVLLNLGQSMPDDLDRFPRILEIVGRDDASLAQARLRFKRYKNDGCLIEHHDMSHK